MNVTPSRLRCECTWCLIEEEKQAVFSSVHCSCLYSSLVEGHEVGHMYKCKICRLVWVIVCVCEHFCAHACISITFVSVDKSRHSPLFMHIISCMRLCVYVADQAYLHPSFTAIPIIYSPPGLQHGFWPAALYQPLCCTAFPRRSPTISCFLSCNAHRWTTAGTEHFITTTCREKQRLTGRWAQGSRRPLLGWDIL